MSDMRRREFITLLGGAAAAWPVAARAQQGRADAAHRRAHHFPANDLEGQTRLTAFSQALQQLGWTDGRNVRIDTRWGSLKPTFANRRRNWSSSPPTSS